MNNLLFTYALVQSFYDQGNDYIDSFWPFAIQVIEEQEFSDTLEIQGKILEKCGFTIPLHVIGTILKRARRKGYLEYKYKSSGTQRVEYYKLTPKGTKYLNELEKQEEVNDRIESLIKDIKQYFKEQKKDIAEDKIKDLLLSIFQENQLSLQEFLNPQKVISLNSNYSKEITDILIDYIKLAENTKPDQYQTIQDILLGSIISAVISLGEQQTLHDLLTKRFSKCRVYLDSNFILSLLELRPSGEVIEGAKELFQLIKDYGLLPRVFDFTVDEIAHVLSYYFTDEYRYSKNIIVDDVCSWKRDCEYFTFY